MSIEEILETDEDNSRKSRGTLRELDERIPGVFEDIHQHLNTVLRLHDESGRQDAAWEKIDRIAAELGTTRDDLVSRIKQEEPGRKIRFAAQARRVLLNVQTRQMLLLAVARYYAWGATDIRRVRLMSASANLRLQIEAVGILLLSSTDDWVTFRWFLAQDDHKGVKFFKRYRRSIERMLDSVGLTSGYRIASATGHHVRVGSLALAYGPQYSTLDLTDYDPQRPERFHQFIVWYLTNQIRVLDALAVAVPQALDPIHQARVRATEGIVAEAKQKLKHAKSERKPRKIPPQPPV